MVDGCLSFLSPVAAWEPAAVVGDSETRPLIGAVSFVLPFGKTTNIQFHILTRLFAWPSPFGLSTPLFLSEIRTCRIQKPTDVGDWTPL